MAMACLFLACKFDITDTQMRPSSDFVRCIIGQHWIEICGYRVPPIPMRQAKLHQAEMEVLEIIEFDVGQNVTFNKVLELFRHQGILYSSDSCATGSVISFSEVVDKCCDDITTKIFR
jgi:hypothetical protein